MSSDFFKRLTDNDLLLYYKEYKDWNIPELLSEHFEREMLIEIACRWHNLIKDDRNENMLNQRAANIKQIKSLQNSSV